MKFNERLKELRVENNLSKKALTDLINIKYSTYANYESGIREPNSDFLLLISNFYDVSIDYILGLSDIKPKVEDVFKLTNYENDIIKKYRSLSAESKELINTIIDFELKRVKNLSP